MKGRLGIALASLVGALLLTATPALGAQTTKTLSFPLSGSSSTNIFDLGPYTCCEIDIDIFGGHIGGDISAELTLDVVTELNAPTHSDLTFTDTNLRQGRTLDLTNTYSRDPGSQLDVTYNLAAHLDFYGFNVDPAKSEGDTLDCSVPLLTEQCQHTKQIGLFDFTLLDLGVGSVDIHFSVPITTTADLNGPGVSSERTITVASSPILGPGTLTFTSDPFVQDESTFLSCSLPANEPVNYAMGTATSPVDGSVQENVGLAVSLIGNPIVGDSFDIAGPFTVFSFDLDPVGLDTIDLSAPGQNVDLGNLLPNNIAPTVAMDTIPTDGVEGSPIQLSVKGTGPGGSMSPCGDANLDIHWSFDDGGSAFGKTIHHAWADNFLGDPSPPHTGQVVVTDPTGLKTTLNFSVPVANVDPSVNAGPDKTALWGVPVSFHGNGSDTGPVDNSILTYLWDFDDPNAPLGAAGQDVSHVYSMPGSYTAQVTVTDNDADQGTDTVDVTVLKRATTTSYTGPIQSNPAKTLTLTASLVDELNQPVAGASILFTLGAQSISANTNEAGVATATLKLNQKHGTYAVAASFAGNDKYLASSNGQTFTIGQ